MDFSGKIKEAIRQSEFWIEGKTKNNGRTLFPLKCPACGHPEAWAYSARPYAINCNRNASCGVVSKIRELFPDLLRKVERDFAPTKADPHRPARAFLEMRALSAVSLEKLSFEYWKNIRNSGGGGVMFPVDATTGVYNGRLFDPPPGEGKTHNKGSTSGKFWRHPGRKYDPEAETLIVEGIIDALSLIEMGLQAIAVLSSGQDPEKVDLSALKKLVFAFDNDVAGIRATQKWMTFYKNRPDIVASAILPPGEKDWNKLLQSWRHGDPAALFAKNRREFEFNAALAAAATPWEYARLYIDFHGRDAGLFTHGGGMYFGKRKPAKKQDEPPIIIVDGCGNFSLKVDHFQRRDESPDYPEFRATLKVKPTKGPETMFTARAKELSNPMAMTTVFLERAKVHWHGDSAATAALLEKIVNAKAPVVRQLETIGLDTISGCYVFPSFLVDKQGKILHPDGRGVYQASHRDYIRPWKDSELHAIHPDMTGDHAREIYDLLVAAYGMERGAVAVAWEAASWFVTTIKKELGFFPFLSLYHDPGAGKTGLVRILNALQCIQEEGLPIASTSTRKGGERKLSQRSGLFTALLEATVDQNGKNKAFDFDRLLTLYNENSLGLSAKFSNDRATNQLPFQSALIFVQNIEPFTTRAQRERTLSVRFCKKYLTPETSTAFQKLSGMAPGKLASFFITVMRHRPDIENHWLEEYHTAHEELSAILAEGQGLDKLPDPRLCGNYALVLAFHRLLLKAIGHQAIDIKPVVIKLLLLKQKQVNRRDDSVADFFFNIIFELAESDQESGLWYHLKAEVDKLYIRLPGALSSIEKSKHTLKASLKEIQAALREHPAYVSSDTAHRFRNNMIESIQKAYIFDVEKVVGDGVDLSELD